MHLHLFKHLARSTEIFFGYTGTLLFLIFDSSAICLVHMEWQSVNRRGLRPKYSGTLDTADRCPVYTIIFTDPIYLN